MKSTPRIITVVLFAVGFGGLLMRWYDSYESYKRYVEHNGEVRLEMRLHAAADLALLEELEAGRDENAKSILAHQVASYYHTFNNSKHPFPSPEPGMQELFKRIEASSGKLPKLREALDGKPH
jgi:hypothetical protein